MTFLEVREGALEQLTEVGYACDIDDTITQTRLAAFEYFKKEFGSQYDAQTLYNMYRFVRMNPEWDTKEHMEVIHHYFEEPESYRNLLPLENSIDTLKNLIRKGHIKSFITARPSQVDPVTKEYFETYDVPELPLVSRHHGSIFIKSNGEWKSDILKRKYPTVQGIIDDDINTLKWLDRLGYEGTYVLIGQKELPIKTRIKAYPAPDWLAVDELFESKLYK